MRPPRLGAVILLVTTPLFLLVQLLVGLRWHHPPFSWAVNNVSDLGNVHCGRWDTTRPRDVCSPWHPVMNTAMVATGLLLAAGVLLTWSIAARTTQLLTLAAAGGWALAGLFPADADENNHFLAALLIFIPGNLAVLAAALSRSSPVLRSMRPVSLTLGLLGVTGSILFAARIGPVVGLGGMERVAAFALLFWTTVLGARLLRRSAADLRQQTADRGRRAGRPRAPAKDKARPVIARAGLGYPSRVDTTRWEADMAFDDKVDNKSEELGGKVKEGVGKATDDKSLEAEGKADQSGSKLKQAGENIKDAFKS